MRFVLAIVAFFLAAIMIGAGIAQRTVWKPADQVAANLTVANAAAFTVISGKTLGEHPNQQTITISGHGTVFAAYGRTADVLSWLGKTSYARVTYDSATNKLESTVVTHPLTGSNDQTPPATPAPTDTPTAVPSAPAGAESTPSAHGPNPDGSDLWLQQYVGKDYLLLRENLPPTVTLIIASDGTRPAPGNISLSWPVSTAIPWSGPLTAGGSLLFLIGLYLYVWALIAMRRARGPRRRGRKLPKLPKSRRYRQSKQRAIISSSRGRRSNHRHLIAVIPTLLVGTLLLAGCSAKYWPQLGSGSEPSATPSPVISEPPGTRKDVLPPAVTTAQLEHIVSRIATVAKDADAQNDSTLAATRFTGPALQLRDANYAIRKKLSSQKPLHEIPGNAPLTVILPQATDSWPRIVEGVVQDKNDTKTPPQFLVLKQNTPRDNYLAAYSIELEPKVHVPDLAPANIGSSLIPPDTKLLRIAPQDLISAYSSVLENGEESKYYSYFDAATDNLRSQVGQDYRAKKKADLPKTATISFADSEGAGLPISMATNDSGALVTATLNETETVKPVEAGAEVSPEGAVKALSGVTSTKKGIASTYALQLLFYVPPANSQVKIRLLGFTLGLITSSEIK